MPTPQKISSSRELAKLAGVSHMTVSRAFRNDPAVSAKTRDHILELANKHGYQPNPIHTLHMRKSSGKRKQQAKGCITFIHNNFQKNNKVSSWKNVPHQKPILIGLEAQAASYGFSLDEFYVGPHENGLSTTRLNSILRARGILGIILGPPTYPEAYEGIDWSSHVGVTLTHHEYPPHLPRVSFDNLHTIHTCITELEALGYKRIGLCAPRKFDAYHLYAWSGCLLVRHQLTASEIPTPWFRYEDPDIRERKDEFYAWLESEKPDAIVCIDRAVRNLLTQKGLRVPEDIALAHTAVEQDVHTWSGYRIDREAQGKATVDLLMSRMIQNEFGIPEAPTETLLRGKWQHGDSTKPPA